MKIFNPVITDVLNPLEIKKDSTITFKVGILAEEGEIFRFRTIVEMRLGDLRYSRYIVYSNVNPEKEYVIEAFPVKGGKPEVRVYQMVTTVPFSEDFLYNVAGQRFMTRTLDDGTEIEYQRVVDPDNVDRVDGAFLKAAVYNVALTDVENHHQYDTWEYQRDKDGLPEYLNVEMDKETGMFRIFVGELIEEIFYDLNV